ncbi:MAG TPA: RluA family pseudouridine synthase [Symbiobacteriaceae bacterium]|nr:RluA family pseudouridine synthase [Symbiobacteriaceae bacterium]
MSWLEFQVPRESKPVRLGRFLYDRLGLSRTLVRRAKATAAIWVDGAPAHLDRMLQGGEVVRIEPPAAEGRVEPEPMELKVVWEDEHLLVVEKPAGIVVHPVKDYQSGTLANGVAYHLLQRGEEPIARPIQRLDRETSGLILWAKNQAVAGLLSGALEEAKLERRYLAFVVGAPTAESGTVDLAIRRVWLHPVAREVALGPREPEQEAALAEAAAAGTVLRGDWTGAGQRSVTHWRVVERYRSASLIECRLETGRTHQIRVHLTHLGHPLLGDQLYGRREEDADSSVRIGSTDFATPPAASGRVGSAWGVTIDRQALHAAALAFRHPFSGEMLRFESPLPPDLAQLRESLLKE